MASSSGNKIICVGSNFYGQLGIGGKVRSHPPYIPTQFGCSNIADKDSQPPSIVKTNLHSHIAKGSGDEEDGSNRNSSLDVNNIVDIQCGSTYSAILDRRGQVRVCGYMHGTMYPSPMSLNLPSALACVKLACGNKHMLMLLEGGYVLSMGCGYFGQLGHGDDNSVVTTPKLITVLDPSKKYLDNDGIVTNITAGPYTSAFVVSCNKPRGVSNGYLSHAGRVHAVYMCGLNGSGQCAITAPAGTRDLSEYKTIVRPTLINMPVFDYNTSGGPTSSQKGGSGSSKYVTVPSASSPLGSLGSRVFPFNLGFGGSSQKNSGVQFCGDIEIVLARHHTTMLHVPTNRLYAWGSTLYGQLGVSSLSNTDTVNVQNIGIGSGNSSAQARRRLSVPQEIHVASVTGGVPVTVTGLKGGGLEDICTITGCLQSVGGGVSVLTYAVGLACGEHHNLMLTSSLPLTEAPRDVTTGPSTKDKDAPPVYMMVPSADGGPCEYSPLTQLYSWGYNLEGQCGHSGSVAHVKSPRSIEFFNPSNNLNIRSIHCGYNQCLVVATNTLGATRPAPVLTPGCLSAVPSKRESMLEANPTHGGSAEGSMIFGWGYADGGWMGAVTPNPDTLPYIDPDNLVPGGQYPHSQARMFDCNCILLTPTRIKSMVPNIYSTRPSSATIGIGASGSASTEASMSSKSFGNYDTVSENVPSSPGCYVPKAIRCGYTHTVVFLQHCEGTVSGSGSQQTGAKRHFVAGTGAEISDDSDDGVNSKADSKSAKEKGVKGGLFGKSSALVGKLSGKNSRAVSPVPTPAASHQQQMELLFHIAKRHCVPGQPDGVGLLDAFSAALRGLLAANVNVDLLVDAADDDNTLLISACKYLTRSANGHTASAQGTRLQLFHIIKHIVGTCVYVESNSGAVSIINAQNKGGNSALHYCFGAHKHEDITPSEASMISGHTLGEYLLSLNDTSLHTTLRDIQLEIKLSVNDLLTNAHGLTCYEGITPEDLEQL